VSVALLGSQLRVNVVSVEQLDALRDDVHRAALDLDRPNVLPTRSVQLAAYVECLRRLVILDRETSRFRRIRVRLGVGHCDGERRRWA
jgi:hypothetical protein